MNWQSDPALFRIEMERRIRRGLTRTAIIWTPLFVVALGAFVYWAIIPFAEGKGLRLFPFFLFGGMAVLFGFQGIQAMRDLRDGPKTTTGLVARSWRARDSLVFRTHYIRLESREILRGETAFHGHIKNGDYIEATYYPRSSVLIECYTIEPPRLPDPPDEHRGPVETVEAPRFPEREPDGDLRGRLGL